MMVPVMAVMMMVPGAGKSGHSQRHQKQGSNNELLHSKNLAHR
jgi:hypothetical protein